MAPFERKKAKRSGKLTVHLDGSETIFEAFSLLKDLVSLTQDKSIKSVTVDASGLQELDTTLAQQLLAMAKWAEREGKTLEIKGMPAELGNLLMESGIDLPYFESNAA